MLLSGRRGAGLAVLLAAGLCATAPAAEKTTLRYKFKEGETLPYVVEQTMTMEMAVMGNEFKMEMKQVMDMTWKIVSVDKDGKARIKQTIDRVRLTVDGPMGKSQFDTKEDKVPEDPVGQAVAPVFKAIAGADLTLTMDPTGRTSDVHLSDKFKKALENVPRGGAGFGDMLSEEGLKRMMNQAGIVLPAAPVGKGESWSSKAEMKSPVGKMVIDTKYTYEGEGRHAGKVVEKIGVKPSLTLEPDPNSPISVKLKSTDSKGTAWFDNKAGRLLGTDMSQDMVMDLEVGGNSITQKLKTVVAMKLADKAR